MKTKTQKAKTKDRLKTKVINDALKKEDFKGSSMGASSKEDLKVFAERMKAMRGGKKK